MGSVLTDRKLALIPLFNLMQKMFSILASRALLMLAGCYGIAVFGDEGRGGTAVREAGIVAAPRGAQVDAKPGLATGPISYLPPPGAKPGRFNVRSRGPSSPPRLQVIAPKETGLTSADKPSLYFYVSKQVTNRVEFALRTVDFKDAEQPAETVRRRLQLGINKIDLAKYEVQLKPELDYFWVVSIVLDEEDRSKDIVSLGVIQRVPLKNERQTEMTDAKELLRPRLLASWGYWYDLIDSLHRLMELNPGDVSVKQQFQDLLAQVGLEDVPF